MVFLTNTQLSFAFVVLEVVVVLEVLRLLPLRKAPQTWRCPFFCTTLKEAVLGQKAFILPAVKRLGQHLVFRCCCSWQDVWLKKETFAFMGHGRIIICLG